MSVPSKPKILLTDPDYFTADSLRRLKKLGFLTAQKMTRKELLKSVESADALVVRVETQVNKELIKHAKKLRCVVSATVGTNHVDIKTLEARGIKFFSLRGEYAVSTAEHALALMLAAARNIPAAHVTMISGGWDRSDYLGVELTGKTLGIFGMGRIGKELAERAKGFRMEILGCDPFLTAEQIGANGGKKVEWNELLKRSDFISVHAPLLPSTRGLLNAKAFKLMKPSAILVNTARAELVDQKALLDALAKGKIRAAAVDVYPKEPLPKKHPLRTYAKNHKNLVLTPHLGASTGECVERASAFVAATIQDFFHKRLSSRT